MVVDATFCDHMLDTLALCIIHSNRHVCCVFGVEFDEILAIPEILTKLTNQAKTSKYGIFHF